MFIFKPYIVLHFVLVKSHTYYRSLNTNLLNLFRLYLKLEKLMAFFITIIMTLNIHKISSIMLKILNLPI